MIADALEHDEVHQRSLKTGQNMFPKIEHQRVCCLRWAQRSLVPLSLSHNLNMMAVSSTSCSAAALESSGHSRGRSGSAAAAVRLPPPRRSLTASAFAILARSRGYVQCSPMRQNLDVTPDRHCSCSFTTAGPHCKEAMLFTYLTTCKDHGCVGVCFFTTAQPRPADLTLNFCSFNHNGPSAISNHAFRTFSGLSEHAAQGPFGKRSEWLSLGVSSLNASNC